MKVLKLLCITIIATLIICQNAEVKADVSLTGSNINLTTTANANVNSSVSSASCWGTTLQGKCNKQRMLFSKFKVDDQESICALFEIKTDGCYFKADKASVDKLNALKDETLNKLTNAVNKYVSDKFIKVQAKVLKAQEKNASKVDLKSVDKMSDVTQRSAIVAKKIFENSIRKPFEALGLNPTDLNKVTAEAKVMSSTSVGRMLTEAEVDAVITLPTLDGIVDIQNEIEKFDDAEIELTAETDNTLKIILAEQEVENLMTVNTSVANLDSENVAKVGIDFEKLNSRFNIASKATSTNDSATLKNDTKKLEVKANIEAKKLCQETIRESTDMCDGDSLCIDIAVAACNKSNRDKIQTMTKESSNLTFDQILQKTKEESSKVADLVKETKVKFTEKNEKLTEFKMEFKNDFETKKNEMMKEIEERFSSEGKTGGKMNFEMNLEDFNVKTNIKINEVKNSLNTNAFVPKELENLFSKEERDQLVKNTIKDESKLASMMKDSKDFMKGGIDSIEKAFSGLFDSDKMKDDLMKSINSDKNLSAKQKADLEASIKAGKNLTSEQEKLLEASMKDNKGMMEQMSKSMEKAMGGLADLFGGMTKSITDSFGSLSGGVNNNTQIKADVTKSTTDALKSATDLFKSSTLMNDAIKNANSITANSSTLLNDAIKSANSITANSSTLLNDAIKSSNTIAANTSILSNDAIKSSNTITANTTINPSPLINDTVRPLTDPLKAATDLLSAMPKIGTRFLQTNNEVKVNTEVVNGDVKVNVAVKEDVIKGEEVKMTLTSTNNSSTNSVKTNSNVNIKSNNSISLDNVPYSFTISSLLGCTQEASILNEFMDGLLALTVDSKTNPEMSKEIIKLLSVVKAFPHPKINRISPLYEELLCTKKFDSTKVKDALEGLEKSEIPCFLKINKDGAKTCERVLVDKTKTTENEKAKGSEATFICNKGVCAALFERGANISLYIKGSVSFDVFSSQRKITSGCLNNQLSLEECCHIVGYTEKQKEIAKARLLGEGKVQKSEKLCKSEIKEAKANYKALLTINIPTDTTEFDSMVKNVFEGQNISAEIKVKGRLLAGEMYVTGSDSTVYSKSNSGLSAESDSNYAVAGSTPAKKATFEESLDSTMTAKAGLQLAETSSSFIKITVSIILLALLFL